MKPIHALAVLGALAAGPALAQQQGPSAGAARPDAVIMGIEIPDQAVQPEYLAKVQQQLKSQGYYQGPVDGVYGDRTRAALAAWQRDNGMQATGQLDARTVAAMDTGSSARSMPQQAEAPDTQREWPQGQQQSPDQQAASPFDDASNIEQLRNESMSSPNIEGEAVPERPGTGAAAPNVPADELTLPPQD